MAILHLEYNRRPQFWFFIVVCWCLLLNGCGTDNIAKPYTPLTTEEKAREALRDENYTEAIELFQAAIEEDPENYQLFRYLATAIAVVSGFDLFEFFSNQIRGGEADLSANIRQSLPSDPSLEQLNLLNQSIGILLSIPVSYRDPAISSGAATKSIAIQIAIYQTGYSLMYLNRFNQKKSDGSLDRQRLESMSDEDAEAIMSSLRSVVESSANPALSADVNKIINEMEAQDGDSQRDRLIQYIESKG